MVPFQGPKASETVAVFSAQLVQCSVRDAHQPQRYSSAFSRKL